MDNAPAAGLRDRLAERILALRYEAIDPAAIAKAKQIILYHAWLSFFALQEKDPEVPRALAVTRALSPSGGPCRVIGHEFTASALDAAFANCHLMRGTGYDDVIFPVGIHPALHTLPVAFALGEQLKKSGREVLAAIVAGYEVLGKLGRWSWSNAAPRRPSMLFGPFGAAIVAALLNGYDRERLAHTLGYAAHMAMGLAESIGTDAHMYGMICRTGMMSALLAGAGGTSSAAILEGQLGFFQSFFGYVPDNIDGMLDSFGSNYAVFWSREKRYPGTALNIVAIEGMRRLVREHGLRADNVRAVKVHFSVDRTYHTTAHHPGPFIHRQQAGASCPFQLARLLARGDIDLSRKDNDIADPRLLALARMVEIVYVEGRSPQYGRVEVTTADGQTFAAEDSDYAFEPLDPQAQLMKYAEPYLGAAKIGKFVALANALEGLEDISQLTACLVPEATTD
jgi:2-methylcitrate dehydratase PrpD